jgi:tagaturonate reductase
MYLSAQLTKKNDYPVKVIMFGTGNFLRGFFAPIINILNEKDFFNGQIQVIKNTKTGSKKSINDQDGLYYLIEEGFINNQEYISNKLITCINNVLNPFENYNTYLDLALNPELKIIVSNTTEKGIFFDKSTLNTKECPENFSAKLTLLLYFRFKNYTQFATDVIAIIPCELIENNGQILKKCVVDYAKLWNLDLEFYSYLSSCIHFYDTLVDRIVPGYPREKTNLEYEDEFTVKAEPYWVFLLKGDSVLKQILPYETNFPNIQLVDDLNIHRNLKVSILNGLHTLMVSYGGLFGIKTVLEFMENKNALAFIENCVYKNIIPSLENIESVSINYTKSVFERYLNPFFAHQLNAIALNSISKFRVRVLPSIKKYVSKKNELPEYLIEGFSNLLFLYNPHFKSNTIKINDTAEYIFILHLFWSKPLNYKNVQNLLSEPTLWEENLNTIANLANAVLYNLSQLVAHNLPQTNEKTI